MKKMLFALVLLLPALASEGKVITVDDDGPADFSNISDAMNSSRHGDTVVVKTGTYNQRISFDNMAVTLTSEDPDDPNIVKATIIAVYSDYSVNFDFEEGPNSVLTGFTITGRGIHCYASSPTISKNVITDCDTYGIYGENKAAPIISNNTISSNRQHALYRCNGPITGNVISENGGGIAYCDGPIAENIIINNSDSNPGLGGALSYCKGKINRNIITDNFAFYKGGALHECSGEIAGNLIVANRSLISGGGLSNCYGTIANNIIAGNKSGSGGGLFGCVKIYNNTIVGNIANERGGGLSQCPGYVNNNVIAFNKATISGGIYGASINSYNAFWSNEGGNFGGGTAAGPGDIIANPLFAIDGYWDPNGTDDESDDFWVDGDYHVKSEAGRWSPTERKWVNESVTSLCIDAGDPNSYWTAELWPHGRRTNTGAYGGTPEASMSMSTAGNPADLNPDVSDANDWVDYSDLALFTDKWLSEDAPLAEDLDRDGAVNFVDFAILADNWRPKPPEPLPPTPNPMTWATEPHATSRTSIAMTAATAVSTDASGVEYYFDCTTGNGHDSGWLDTPDYTDTGLTAGTAYTYQVKARNKANSIETAYSDPRSATTEPEDTSPPSPNPATWATEPYVIPPASIRMAAMTASDASGVEYYFDCTSNQAYSSGWQDSSVYEVTSLPKGTYSFVVRVRDKSPNRNTTGDSSAITLDLSAPTPDPMRWESEPAEVYHGGGSFDYWAEMTAAEATDSSGGVQYYFQCTTESGFSSGWQDSRIYNVKVGRRGQNQQFRVNARDKHGNETSFSITLPAD
ncbi:MAG: right-handed parallel beta-helix repeat-containing protein [Planctomycetota bacterium]